MSAVALAMPTPEPEPTPEPIRVAVLSDVRGLWRCRRDGHTRWWYGEEVLLLNERRIELHYYADCVAHDPAVCARCGYRSCSPLTFVRVPPAREDTLNKWQRGHANNARVGWRIDN